METQIANIIMALIKVGPTVITTIEQVIPVAQDIIAKVKSPTPPTQAEWDALHASIEALETGIADAPLPADNQGP